MPSALALGHANSPGLVYGFLTDSSASLLVELPKYKKTNYEGHKWYNKNIFKDH